MEDGEKELGLRLIANGQVHDHSKFFGIEYRWLNDGAWPLVAQDATNLALFNAAKHQHVTTNAHHIEFWPGGADEMDRLHMAEMVADWHARASEQGTCLISWVKEVATKKYEFSTSGRVYKELKGFIDLLLDKRFK